MNEEILEMSGKERDRLFLLRQVEKGMLSQMKAAKLLKITDRQVRNLLTKIKIEGDKGVISKKRGKPSNNQLPQTLKKRVLGILSEELEGFSPTFAVEKLEELWSIKISKETARLWMIEAGFWNVKSKNRRVYKPRLRRACFGELVQGDGSHHRWFGEDKEMVNLTVLIDDATGKLTGLHFSKEETLIAYFTAMGQHITRYGRPRALYTDRSAICEVRQGDSVTQFHEALMDLDIDLILANSPQAKGRVERANRTLQDRLIKEMRLRGIDNIADANLYLPEFLEAYNQKFSREPRNTVDAHRPLEGHDLTAILRQRKVRTLSASCVFQYDSQFYEVQGLAKTRRHKGRKVNLRIASDESFRVFLDGVERAVIPCEALNEPCKPKVRSRRELDRQRRKERLKRHPWRRWSPGYLRSAKNRRIDAEKGLKKY
jgi:hypothetical protein